MIRKISMTVFIILTAVLQGMVFQIFEIASVKPNLLLIVAVSFGLMRGRMSGLLTGFGCGLAMDLLFPGKIGFYALIYMWIGYLAGFCYRIFYDDDIKTPLMLVFAGGILFGVYQYVFTFMIRGRLDFIFYFSRIIIPEVLYTLIITIFVYRLIFRFNQWLNKSDKRSIDSLV